MYRGRRVAYRVLVRKSEGKRPLGEPRRRWEDRSTGSGMGDMDWIEMAQDRAGDAHL